MVANGIRSLVLAFLLSAGLGAPIRDAHADVVYVWKTLTATLNGLPTSLTASGEITLTDAGFSRGFGQVTTVLGPPPSNVPLVQTLDGVASASFEMFGGPDMTTGQLFSWLINFTAAVRGQDLAINPNNRPATCCLGFMVGFTDDDAYFGTNVLPTPELTVSYGTDNAVSPCFGTQIFPGSRCVVTGIFERVPEPGTLPISLSALGLFLLIKGARRRIVDDGASATPRASARNQRAWGGRRGWFCG